MRRRSCYRCSKYGALLVNFNNQRVELAAAKKSVDTLKAEVKSTNT